LRVAFAPTEAVVVRELPVLVIRLASPFAVHSTALTSLTSSAFPFS
jgi:hypothetical protein